MDQGNLHLVVTDGKPHDQVEFSRIKDIGGAPVCEEISVDEENHAIAVEVEIGMGHISKQRAPAVVRSGKVGLVVKEPSGAGIDRQVLIGKCRAPPAEAAGIGRPVGDECIGIGLYDAASIQGSISFILQPPSPVLDGAGEGINGVPFREPHPAGLPVRKEVLVGIELEVFFIEIRFEMDHMTKADQPAVVRSRGKAGVAHEGAGEEITSNPMLFAVVMDPFHLRQGTSIFLQRPEFRRGRQAEFPEQGCDGQSM